ncbi:hypothetical protein ABB37_04881 [Leptomonas pyrrhocoris]|uniref:Serine protease n=1 Tax=Leptomonas pyrrhocoris TaxID=157538 RepID=A0A0M9G1W0_LEPPY|nr:hypothetical protein ABB37_04881 [Leptomonas pyrrhocoris]XP_015659149.1 hypothetical protein ABB37_04881 [Leptomonas pyrrhocoris]XP_015659150.1 hypothetical protein ABB37_04881 [Leptomonas pyrrhocoris]KPA80709.1 hypothetical protein ABB37_04881 [Leptomonas pyrrhocoris]KPA80710.1 hypothetical protein ABB37_04881 [Leptomonas pyrrhocoris]KPA80711.1 hypothetical protein ABB37_04881 [Leptomonas pyrrhocoris]|eukprot:XP_015659148.1 hypothetical protein ABB37_04881 [Leptomonas pyrrhocoris]
MKPHGLAEVPFIAQPSALVARSICALYWKDAFLGSCVAIAPSIVITAGHHYNANRDDVGDFSVLTRPGHWAAVEYASKNSFFDVVVFWLCEAVEAHVSLRGFLPGVGAQVATVWLSPKPPHAAIVSPGVVVESEQENCVARGTVSTTGSSGAPVVDVFGEHVVGLHLTSNTRDGSRVSGFLPARKLVSLLAEMGVNHARVQS